MVICNLSVNELTGNAAPLHLVEDKSDVFNHTTVPPDNCLMLSLLMLVLLDVTVNVNVNVNLYST